MTLPEEMSLAEAEDGIGTLERAGIRVGSVIVNRVIPDGPPCPICDRGRRGERRVVEFLRKLMERQAIRRMEQKTLTRKEVEAVGVALMRLEETIKEIGARFGLSPEDLNLDLGPLGKLM